MKGKTKLTILEGETISKRQHRQTKTKPKPLHHHTTAMDEEGLPLGAQQTRDNELNDDKREAEHFQQVCRSYQQYATFHQTRRQGVNHRIDKMIKEDAGGQVQGPTLHSILPPHLRPHTPQSQQHSALFCEATIRNQFFLDNVLKYSGVPTSQEMLQLQEVKRSKSKVDWVTEDSMSKIDSVFKSLARDWSAEGREERSVAYDRILNALDEYLPVEGIMDGPPRVAVPGSGLGRLAWEVYSKGYSSQGSDFSLPMLLASDFILNGCSIPVNGGSDAEITSQYRQFTISPWIAETKNATSCQERLRTVIVPDVDPSSKQLSRKEDDENESNAAAEFTMLAGEFLSLYSHFLPSHSTSCDQDDHHHHIHHSLSSRKFHAVACSFFIDTAPSLPHYLITIYHMLEEGGLFVNYGPLMYHWSGHGNLLPRDLDVDGDVVCISKKYQTRNAYLDARYLSNVDYTWSEIRHMILSCGFEILIEEMNIPTKYTSDDESMMNVVYNCTFLVARKRTS